MKKTEDNQKIENRLNAMDNRIKHLEEILLSGEPVNMSRKQIGATEYNEEIVGDEEPKAPNAFLNWLKEDWLMKLGAFLLILALGWFVRYAFINNWIGPIGRIALGIIVGAIFMGIGHWQIPKRNQPGQVFVAMGAIMILLTVFAARVFYDFFTPVSALGIMSLVIIGMAIIAIIRNTKALAYMALLGGALVPILAHSGNKDYLALLSYIFILDIGVLIVVAMKGWRGLILTALFITGLFSMVFHSMDVTKVWIFMAMFFGFFFVANLSAMLHSKKVFVSDLFTTGISGLLFLYWVYEFIPREWASIILSAVILVLISVSYLLKRVGNLNQPLYLYTGLATLFLGVATSFELDGSWLTIAYAIEALVLVVLSDLLIKNRPITMGVSALQILPVFLSIKDISYYNLQELPLFNQHFFAILTVILSIGATGFFLQKDKEEAIEEMPMTLIHYTIAIILSIILIWLFMHNLFDSRNVAKGASLVLYTIAGISFVFAGAHKNSKYHRIIGGLIVAGVILRLLFVEIWAMDLVGRIITFVAIGALLILTAFFKKRLK